MSFSADEYEAILDHLRVVESVGESNPFDSLMRVKPHLVRLSEERRNQVLLALLVDVFDCPLSNSKKAVKSFWYDEDKEEVDRLLDAKRS